MTKIVFNPVAEEELQLLVDESLYVPYTGATTNVDLGIYDLTTTGFLQSGEYLKQIWADDGVEGCKFDIFKDSSSPAINDTLGYIRFWGRDDLGVQAMYGQIDCQIVETDSNGFNSGRLIFRGAKDGILTESFEFTKDENIFNEQGLDIDLRVESEHNANMLFVDANSDKVGIGTIPSGTYTFEVNGSVGAGAMTGTSITDSGLTSGRVTFAGTAGLLKDDAGLTYNSGTDTLALNLDNSPLTFGVAADSKIVFTGTQLRIHSDLVTATDAMILFAGTTGLYTYVGNVGQASILANRYNYGSGSAAAAFHYGTAGLMFKQGDGSDRSLFELHSPNGTARMAIQAVSAGAAYDGIYIQSLSALPTIYQTKMFHGYTRFDGGEVEEFLRFSNDYGTTIPAGIGLTGTRLQITDGSTGLGALNVGTLYNNADNSTHYFGAAADASIYYDGTDLTINTSLVSASDLNLTCGANKTLELQNVVWNDINVSMITGKLPDANYPTWTANTTNLYSYTFAVGDYLDLSTAEILHNYKEGTDLGLHLHIITNGTEVGDTKAQYTIYYNLGDMNEAMGGELTSTAELTIVGGTADRTHLLLDFPDVTGTGYKIGSLLKMRIKRIAKSAGGADPAANPFIEQLGIHYQIDTIGSRQELVK